MKTAIHPKYDKAIVTCTCGNSFETNSTIDKIDVEICSACHPFYTGKQKLVDTAGRVDRFRMKLEASAAKKAGTNGKKDKPSKGNIANTKVTLSDIKSELKDELVKTTSENKKEA